MIALETHRECLMESV